MRVHIRYSICVCHAQHSVLQSRPTKKGCTINMNTCVWRIGMIYITYTSELLLGIGTLRSPPSLVWLSTVNPSTLLVVVPGSTFRRLETKVAKRLSSGSTTHSPGYVWAIQRLGPVLRNLKSGCRLDPYSRPASMAGMLYQIPLLTDGTRLLRRLHTFLSITKYQNLGWTSWSVFFYARADTINSMWVIS